MGFSASNIMYLAINVLILFISCKNGKILQRKTYFSSDAYVYFYIYSLAEHCIMPRIEIFCFELHLAITVILSFCMSVWIFVCWKSSKHFNEPKIYYLYSLKFFSYLLRSTNCEVFSMRHLIYYLSMLMVICFYPFFFGSTYENSIIFLF